MKGKVIRFDQPAEFFYNSAQKMMDGGAYINALSTIRRAVKMDPANYEFTLCLAEVLTELTRYEESNRVLFDLIERQEDVDPDCFFCLGCNFMGLNDVDKAKESFEKYLQVDPEGDYSDEVEDFLYYFDVEEESIRDFLEDTDDASYERATKGKQYLDQAEYEKAAEVLESINESDENFSYARNNLALAYYCLKKPEKAIEVTEAVLKKNKYNIHANCNMAIFRNEHDSHDAAMGYVENAIAANPSTTEDLYKLAITMCELNMHEEAIRYLRELAERTPYDEKVLFYLASALHNTKRLREAIIILDDVKKLDYPGVIAEYYIKHINHELANPGEFELMDYIYQVPAQEAKRKIRYLNDCLKLSDKEFRALWQEDGEFMNTSYWGLEYGDDNIKRAIAGMIAGFADEKAERILREFILNKRQPDEVKSDIFILLKRMNAKEPYVAYINDEVVEVKVGAYDLEGNDLTDEYSKLFKLLHGVVNRHYSEDIMKATIGVVQRYIEDDANVLVPELLNEVGAAILYVALDESGQREDLQSVCEKLDAEIQIVEDYVYFLKKTTPGDTAE